MKKFRKTLGFAVALLMVFSIIPLSALADEDDMIYVDVRIEGVTEMIYLDRNVGLPEGSTALDLVRLLNDMDGVPEIKYTESAMGAYINSIGDLKEMDYIGSSGWLYRVNGIDPGTGIDTFELAESDYVLFFFGDPYSVGYQFPEFNWDKMASEGILSVTSYDFIEWDDLLNPVYGYNPVAGAKITLDGKIYTTDENGELKLDDKNGVSGVKTLQIERYDDESGLSTVLRFEPDHREYIPFADTPSGAWYENAIILCINKWSYKGIDFANNLFAPDDFMPMEQLVTALALLAGAELEKQDDPWYGAERDWAIENGIISEAEFVVGAGVRRDRLIHMFYLTVALTGEQDMDIREDITGATDYDDIDESYIDAVSWAVALNIVQGLEDDELSIAPDVLFSRAMVCELLYKYLG